MDGRLDDDEEGEDDPRATLAEVVVWSTMIPPAAIAGRASAATARTSSSRTPAMAQKVATGTRASSAARASKPRVCASIQSWRRSGGSNREYRADGPPDAWGIADEHGRLMVLMIHNSDIPDGWEREAEEPEYFERFSPGAYAVGINVVLYAMTH